MFRNMFRKKNPKTDWDLDKLSDEKLASLTLVELQRIRNKRWAYGMGELKKRAEEELKRRSPLKDWKCLKCNKTHYHQKIIRTSGGLGSSWLNLETEQFFVIICNYCGKSEMYEVLSDNSLTIDFLGG